MLNLSEVIEKTACKTCSQVTDMQLQFTGVAPLSLAQSEHISFFNNEKYLSDALSSKAGAILCNQATMQLLSNKVTAILLLCPDPYAAFAKISQSFFQPIHPFTGISIHAIIDKSAQVHPSATVFPFAFIGPGAYIGENTTIYSSCFIGATTIIGNNCILYPNVVVMSGCKIADNCIINPGAVIGADGFGFAPTPLENIKIPHIGGVEIAQDVEIGANSTIDRGTLTNTKIARQTKIDNLVMIAHNVEIDEFCLLAAQTGIAGSTTIGKRCKLGGQTGVAGHLKLSDDVIVAAQSGISKNIKDASIWQGSPARLQKDFLQDTAILNRIAKKNKMGSK